MVDRSMRRRRRWMRLGVRSFGRSGVASGCVVLKFGSRALFRLASFARSEMCASIIAFTRCGATKGCVLIKVYVYIDCRRRATRRSGFRRRCRRERFQRRRRRARRNRLKSREPCRRARRRRRGEEARRRNGETSSRCAVHRLCGRFCP